MDPECFNSSKFSSVIELSQCNCTKKPHLYPDFKKQLVYIEPQLGKEAKGPPLSHISSWHGTELSK